MYSLFNKQPEKIINGTKTGPASASAKKISLILFNYNDEIKEFLFS